MVFTRFKTIIFSTLILTACNPTAAPKQVQNAELLTAADQGICESLGAYSTQENCQDQEGEGCLQVILSLGKQDYACFHSGSSSAGDCSGDNWVVGSWSPSNCSSDQQQSRTVTCKTGCSCSTTRPTNTRSCAGQCGSSGWSVTEWSPSTCNSGVKELRRTVSCPSGCNCQGQQPENLKSCSPNLYQGKHYDGECENYKVLAEDSSTKTTQTGSVVVLNGNRVCSIPVKVQNSDESPSPSCPSGWTALKSSGRAYTITERVHYEEHTDAKGGRQYGTTEEHSAFAPVDRECVRICSRRNLFGCSQHTTVCAKTARIACY